MGIETIESPEKFEKENFGKSETLDIFICQALIRQGKYNYIISLLNGSKQKYKSPFLFFMLYSYEKLNRYDEILAEIHLLTSTKEPFESEQYYIMSDF